MTQKATGISGAIAPAPAPTTTWWSHDEDHDDVDIFVTDIHQAYDGLLQEAARENNVVIRDVWHGYDDAAWVDALSQRTADMDFVAGIEEIVLKDRFAGYRVTHDQLYDFDPRMAHVYCVRGTVENVTNLATHLAEETALAAHDVGGDDTYFDYFPSWVETVFQILYALDMREKFDWMRGEIIAACYNDKDGVEGESEDLIVTWPEGGDNG